VHFESCFRKLLTIAGRCVDRHGGQLVILDLTSGPGVVDGCAGSPSIIAEVLREHERAARVWFFERDASSAESLRQMIAAFPLANQRQVYTVVERDHADGVACPVAAASMRERSLAAKLRRWTQGTPEDERGVMVLR
jgi:hypothetical protein